MNVESKQVEYVAFFFYKMTVCNPTMILLRFLDAQRENILANFYNSWKSEFSFKRVLSIGWLINLWLKQKQKKNQIK